MSEKQFRLSKKKRKWAAQFKPTAVSRGPALNYPVGVEVRYHRDVSKILRAVIKAAEKGVMEVFETPAATEFFALDAKSFTVTANESLDALFDRLGAQTQVEAEKAARRMVESSNKSSRAGMAASLKELSGGVTLNPSDLGGAIPEILQASIKANVDLITTISKSYLSKVTDAVNRSIMNGRGLQDLIPFMKAQRKAGVTERHAKNVALDQTRKAYNSLNVARMDNVGLSKFEWLHSGGGQRPREYHQDRWPEGLNGGIFDIHDPPIIDQKTGARGLPAHAINCKCRMIPVLVFDEGEAAA